MNNSKHAVQDVHLKYACEKYYNIITKKNNTIHFLEKHYEEKSLWGLVGLHTF